MIDKIGDEAGWLLPRGLAPGSREGSEAAHRRRPDDLFLVTMRRQYQIALPFNSTPEYQVRVTTSPNFYQAKIDRPRKKSSNIFASLVMLWLHSRRRVDPQFSIHASANNAPHVDAGGCCLSACLSSWFVAMTV